MALDPKVPLPTAAKTIYTCPMHPQIEQDHGGNCPICGMALEPKNFTAADEEENTELDDMTRRVWIGVVLSIPVFVLSDVAHVAWRATVGTGRLVALGAIYLKHARGAVVRMAVLPTWLAISG